MAGEVEGVYCYGLEVSGGQVVGDRELAEYAGSRARDDGRSHCRGAGECRRGELRGAADGPFAGLDQRRSGSRAVFACDEGGQCEFLDRNRATPARTDATQPPSGAASSQQPEQAHQQQAPHPDGSLLLLATDSHSTDAREARAVGK